MSEPSDVPVPESVGLRAQLVATQGLLAALLERLVATGALSEAEWQGIVEDAAIHAAYFEGRRFTGHPDEELGPGPAVAAALAELVKNTGPKD